MRARVYERELASGVALHLDYTDRRGNRQRPRLLFVEHGARFERRLASARREAEAELARRTAAAIERRADPSERRPAPTFEAYVQEVYIPAMKLGTHSARGAMKPEGLARETHRLTKGTLAWFADYPLDRINRSLIEQYLEHRAGQGAGPAGVNRDLARLRNLLNDAADRDELRLELPRIPWGKLRGREQPTSYRAARPGELEGILENVGDRIVRTYLELLAHTGIRPEAALRLRLGDHVDLDDRVVWVDPELDKVGRGYRVYLNAYITAQLRGLVAWRPAALQRSGTELFVHRNRKPRRSVRTAWQAACAAAGVEGLHVRGLRTTFKTRLALAGAGELATERLLGHATRSMASRYFDPDEDSLRAVVELLVPREAVVPELAQERERRTARG